MVLHFQTDTLANKQVSFAVDSDLMVKVKIRLHRGNLSLKFKGNFPMSTYNRKLTVPLQSWDKIRSEEALTIGFCIRSKRVII